MERSPRGDDTLGDTENGVLSLSRLCLSALVPGSLPRGSLLDMVPHADKVPMTPAAPRKDSVRTSEGRLFPPSLWRKLEAE